MTKDEELQAIADTVFNECKELIKTIAMLSNNTKSELAFLGMAANIFASIYILNAHKLLGHPCDEIAQDCMKKALNAIKQ